MPEDLMDKLNDFGLLLKGFTANVKDGSGNTDEECERVISWWFWVFGDIVRLFEPTETAPDEAPSQEAVDESEPEAEKPRRGRKKREQLNE